MNDERSAAPNMLLNPSFFIVHRSSFIVQLTLKPRISMLRACENFHGFA